MDTIVNPEYVTQQRVIQLFVDTLGYSYIGNWKDREGNSCIEEGHLKGYLGNAGYSNDEITRTLHVLSTEAFNPNRSLYDNNKHVYSLLRYGVQVKVAAGEQTERVKLIDWEHPEKNDFAIAEEVTLKGGFERRPDLVLYVNGIALAVIELKKSSVSIGDGIRQLLSNQQKGFNPWFFGTVQFCFAGSDSEGLRYGTIGTEEIFYLTWKEDEADNAGYKLDKYLAKMCAKARFLEVIHDFILFDGGQKKLPRVHQYFGIKAAQERVLRRRGGIIWHTQGSGKSIVMVLLAKWILENHPHARVAIITDRDELDKQIERVFTESGESIHRTQSGRDLMHRLGQAKPRLLCSLVHKFGKKGVDFDAFIEELKSQPCQAVGDIFVFVDECHRTQSGKLHDAMAAYMPNAVFIGFTGTPLLKQDRKSSLETFGGYIHTYLFNEAVEDAVVLDLVYEARDIDQRLSSETHIDQWFEAKTKGLNDWQKAALREKWGTLRAVLSCKSRMDKVVADIIFDFNTKPRLSNHRGTAMLIAGSIFEACRYFALFQATQFKGKCAIVTSYNPQAKDIAKEEIGANTETDRQFIYNLYTNLLQDVQPLPGKSKTETYEDRAKELFIKEPATMKLLIVVDKLLTGFDAPSCTYLYIDKSMQDHGLFQAICRTNRLDGDDKEYGYIVDYKDLFKKVDQAIRVYTSELDHDGLAGKDPEILMQDRLAKGRERLETARETLGLLCEPVEPPRDMLQHIHYFCGNTENPADLKSHEPQRVAFYKGVSSLIRAYASLSDELAEAGYNPVGIQSLTADIDRYLSLRESIKMTAGEVLDTKPFEADMRHLIDTYIEASAPRPISPFEGLTLLEIIQSAGLTKAIDTLPTHLKGNMDAVAETIENNVRSKIIREHLNDPAYYDSMAALLDEIIADRKRKALKYEEYLKKIAELAKQVQTGQSAETPPELTTPGRRALYHNLLTVSLDMPDGDVLALVIRIDERIKTRGPADWRGIQAREQVIKRELLEVVTDEALVELVFPILKQHAEY